MIKPNKLYSDNGAPVVNLSTGPRSPLEGNWCS